MPSLYDELKGEGLDPEGFIKVYDVVRSVTGEIDLEHLKIANVGKYQLDTIFKYMDKQGVLEKKNGNYEVNQEGINVMNSRMVSDNLQGTIKEKKEKKRRGE